MTDTAETFHNDVTMLRNDQDHQYELRVGETLTTVAQFNDLPGHVDFIHTETLEPFGGKGMAKILARYALDDVAASGKRIIPHCSFIAGFLRRHEDYVQVTDWPETA
ncbi:GNAT family N-acetyltransferase [Paenarthrobacter sp. PH39-S1]|uniref:GNAT family N-acetyltransferase n=1 Tax=Micrococcaceae TaxID=1268 RepID=UPI0024B9A123|nr:GNAT family N-acetyltransferase [Paenarthrobacter sp. PH39-S1]MDJ0354951.1 GNAT family N-acetyltransferase [Paenarthrobacter sp. PH39-S1]